MRPHCLADLRHELPPLGVTNGIDVLSSGNEPAVGEDAGLESVDILREPCHAQRGADLAVVDGEGQPRGEEVDEVVDHHVAERRGEEVVPQLRFADHGHLGTVPLLRVLPGQNRDRDADEVEGVAGGVDGVVSLVDPPQLVEVADVLREMIEVDRRLEADSVVVPHPKACERLLRPGCERGRPVDDAAGRIDGIGDHVLDGGGALGRRPGSPVPHRHRQADERLIAAADARVVEILKVAQLGLHLRFVLVAMAGEPALAPHIRLLGDDRAVGIDVVLEPIDLAGELLDGVVLTRGRLVAVERLSRCLETPHEAERIAGARHRGGCQEGGKRAGHGDQREGPAEGQSNREPGHDNPLIACCRRRPGG